MELNELPLFAQASTPEVKKTRALTVTELTQQIRGVVEPSFQNVWVQGEISNCRPAASGHLYFSLKDASASLSAAAFGWGRRTGSARSPRFDVKDGLQVICRGKISIYPPRGSYQLIVDQIEPLGAGALQAAFEALKKRLRAEGLFDASRKKPLPQFPIRVAVVTSPTGAALRDVLNVLQRRAPHLSIRIVPALVQGESAPRSIIEALREAESRGEVILLTRGGGSIEDLWAFNDESLARAIAQCKTPIVSAVGHEIDFTISDFVSDLRAPTPSAGAELITQHWVDVLAKLEEAQNRLFRSMLRERSRRHELLARSGAQRLRDALTRFVEERKRWVLMLSRRVVNPKDRLREQTQRVDEFALRLSSAIQKRLDLRSSRVKEQMGKLDALSPLRVLERGYSIVRDPKKNDRLVKSVSEIQKGKQLRITFHDGETQVQVT